MGEKFMYMIGHYWYLFVIPGLLLGLYAQVKLSAAYGRYSQEPVSSGLSGAEAAREVLDRAGLPSMPVEEVPGHLTDHYDPTKKALFLSSENYHGRSLAAVGVAAHEAGHALQDKAAYAPMQLRQSMVPVMGFATNAAMWIVFASYFFSISRPIAMFGVVVFGLITAFHIVTLPVEWDASRRAKEQLFAMGIVRQEERRAVSRVLDAAGLTYVAAMVSSLMTVLQLLMIARGNDRDRVG
jgi:Zn-dependent membrane protease YugP